MPQYNTTNKLYSDYLEVIIEYNEYKFTPDDIEVFKQHNKIRLISKQTYDIGWVGSIKDLPDNITHLELPNRYNKLIDKCPLNLKVLLLNNNYNKHIELPEQLEEFICPSICKFNQKISFPSNIKLIKFGDCYEQPLHDLPNSLEKLVISYNKQLLDNLPSNLKTLEIVHIADNTINLDYLPLSLTFLELNSHIAKCISIVMNNLPPSLQTLKLFNIRSQNYGFQNLPNGLENLYINGCNNLDLSYLPDKLKQLHIEGTYEEYTVNFSNLPKHLEVFNISNIIINSSDTFKSILYFDYLPLTLKEFTLEYTKYIKNCNNMSITLPDSITMVKIYDSRPLSNNMIELDKIPLSCECLDITIKNNIDTRFIIKQIYEIPNLHLCTFKTPIFNSILNSN
jgi:hypothetical protein